VDVAALPLDELDALPDTVLGDLLRRVVADGTGAAASGNYQVTASSMICCQQVTLSESSMYRPLTGSEGLLPAPTLSLPEGPWKWMAGEVPVRPWPFGARVGAVSVRCSGRCGARVGAVLGRPESAR
ncbi:hypothetical protein ACIQOV_06100, partial [Kitasatospora sp. NPDC091257]|uniref:hypothetical protein n=1 Tax=Kitasatospora sp. NPDC091257 TaxID=3364084 RepID=UPI00382AD82B